MTERDPRGPLRFRFRGGRTGTFFSPLSPGSTGMGRKTLVGLSLPLIGVFLRDVSRKDSRIGSIARRLLGKDTKMKVVEYKAIEKDNKGS